MWFRRFISLSVFCAAAAAGAQIINPSTQIRWPAGCNIAGAVYSFQANSCFIPSPASIPGLNSDGANGIQVTGASRSAGVVDNTGGLPAYPRLLLTAGVGGGTDVCAVFSQQSKNDDTAGFIGRAYQDNLPPGSAAQRCSLATLWDVNLNQASPVLTSSRHTVLSAGIYQVPGLNVPSVTTLEGQWDYSSTSNTGSQIQPRVSGNLSLSSITSASGGTLAVSTGLTCSLSGFNDSLANALVTVTFNATNSWAGATFAIVQAGYGATAAPTSATLNNGTGTCSGTATLTTTLTNKNWMQAYTFRNPTPLINLGPSQGTTGAAFAILAYIRKLGLNGLTVPNTVCVRNSYGQQGSGADHLSISGCPLGVMTDSEAGATAGGSQNRAWWQNLVITLPGSPTNSVASQLSVMNGGTLYTTATATFTGCTTAPQFVPVIVGGIITAWVPNDNATNPFGVCPTGTGPTVAITGDGTGATADATIEMLLPSEGMYFASNAGGGLTEEISVVGGSAVINPDDALGDEAGGQEVEGLYGESVKRVMRINATNTAGIFGDFIHSLRGSSANNWIDSLFENAGAGPAGFTLAGALGSASYAIRDMGIAGNQVPCMSAISSIGGNGCSISLYSRDPSGQVISNLLGVPTTVPIGQMAFNATSGSPQFFMPVKNVGGYATAMTAADAAPPWGVSESGSEAASHTVVSNVVVTGWVPCYFVNTPVPGDYWGISATNTQCSDTGSTTASPPTSGWTGGIVAQDGAAGSVAALTTQVVTGVTSSVTQPSTNDVQYKVVARTATDQTTSAASAAIDVTNGPQGIGGASSVSLLTIPVPATFNYAVYRVVLGRSAEPSVAAICNTTLGTYTRLTITGTMSGIWFPPTVSFSGGTGTNPAVTLYASGGQVIGGTFTSHGSGCTGNLTGSVTASTCEIGFLKFNGSSTTFKDNGICAHPDQAGSTTPPASALIGPRVSINPQHWSGAALTNPMTASGDMVVGGAAGAPARLAAGANGLSLIMTGGTPVWGVPLGFVNGFVNQCGPQGTGTTVGCLASPVTAAGSGGLAVAATSTAPLQVKETTTIVGCTTSAPCTGGWSETSLATAYAGRQPLATFGTSFSTSTDFSANARVQMGLLSSSCTVATMQASDSPACSYVMVESSTVRGDTTWQCVSDSGTGTPVVTASATAPTTAFAKFQVGLNGSGQAFCVIGGVTLTNSTVLTTNALGVALLNGDTSTTTASHIQTNGWFTFSQNGTF